MRLLLAEDDKLLAEGIQEAITEDGYTVDWVEDGESSVHALTYEFFDAAILNIGIPLLDGIAVLKAIRKEGNWIPVLFLTARDAIEDRVLGLDAGADDYLTKPFDIAELKARIRALLRRNYGRANPIIIYRDIRLDPSARQATYRGKQVRLTRREYILLKELIMHSGKVLSREQLIQVLYGWQDEIESNAIEVHIHNLRRKFHSLLIRTIRGVGYIVEAP